MPKRKQVTQELILDKTGEDGDTIRPVVVKDAVYPQMYRVQWPDGEISDMVNLTRAKDAVRCYQEYERRFNNKQAGGGT